MGEMIRDVDGNTQAEQVNFMAEVLSNWKQDIQDFEELAHKFYSLYVQREK